MAVVKIDARLAQRRTAAVMVQAQREIPLFHVSKTVDATALVAGARRDGVSVTAALLPALSAWLTRHGRLNGHWLEDSFVAADVVDLGVAWAHRESVLVVPTLRDCAQWPADRFADVLRDLRVRSDDDAFETGDFATPTFTVSNLGPAGIDDFTSLVTPPQVAVLSLSTITPRAVVRDGDVTVRPILPLTLGVDHRAVDGMYAATALVDLASTLEASS